MLIKLQILYAKIKLKIKLRISTFKINRKKMHSKELKALKKEIWQSIAGALAIAAGICLFLLIL